MTVACLPKVTAARPRFLAALRSTASPPTTPTSKADVSPTTRPSSLVTPVSPSTESQNAKDDAATTPTADLSKIAGLGARIQRITAVAAGSAAPDPSKAAGAAAAPAAAPAVQQQQQAAPAPGAAPAKSAGDTAPFTADVLTKLGSLLVQSEGGVAQGYALLELAEGEKFASQAIQECVYASQVYEKQAADANDQHLEALAHYQQIEQQKEAAAHEFGRIYDSATPAERAQIEHMAKCAAWAEAQPALAHPMLKAAFGEGMADGADDMDAMEGGEAPPTGEEDISPEEIAMLIQQALQEGKIDEATATALMDQLAGGEGQDPAAMGGAPGGADPAMEEEMKAAAALVNPAAA